MRPSGFVSLTLVLTGKIITLDMPTDNAGNPEGLLVRVSDP
jgi:hypothetical protein